MEVDTCWECVDTCVSQGCELVRKGRAGTGGQEPVGGWGVIHRF